MIFRILVTAIALSAATIASATDIVGTSLERQVEQASTIVFGRVEKVTIHDRAGRELNDVAANTGPGESNELRLHVALDAKRVLKGSIPKSQARVSVPLWKGWHNTLGSARDAYEKKDFIFFLSSDLRPSLPAEFVHFDFEKAEIVGVIEKEKKPNQASEPMPMSGTAAAGAPAVPATGMAHL